MKVHPARNDCGRLKWLIYTALLATVACSVAFFWLRVAHAIGMISGLAGFPLRPMIYLAGWILMLAFAWQVMFKAT